MNSYQSVGFVRRFFASAALLAVAAVAGAQEVRPLKGAERAPSFEGMTPQKRIVRPERAGDTAPLMVAVPKLTATPELVAEIILGEKTLVRETIQLEGNVPEHSAVRLMGSQAADLTKVRRIAAARGDELLVRISAGETVVTEDLFRDLDAAASKLVGNANVVGTTRAIEVLLGVKRTTSVAANGYQPDPACESQCNDDYLFCSEFICDQRGSCQFCYEQYLNCTGSCPQVCVDPKDVDDYQRTVYTGSDYYGAHCYTDPRDNQKYYWDVYLEHFRVETVRRTEYCNGSYSEQVISSYNTSRWCYYKWFNSSCSISSGTVPSYQICG